MKKVILDVDTGIDDAIGIMLAVKSEALDVVGITTVSGNVSLETATTNTAKILDLLEDDKTPIFSGAAKPLTRKPHFEHRVHGEDGIGGALKGVATHRKIQEQSAADFIQNQVMAAPGDITLIMTGPLTNLAEAVQQYPEIVSAVKEVIFMGGVVKGVGNVTPVAEYNMFADPEAASIVFEAGFQSLTQVGLDVTRSALLKDEHIDLIQNPVLQDYVRTSTATYRNSYFERNGVWACAMHDPLAVAIAIDSELVKTEWLHVTMETNSTYCDGQTVCDFQNRLGHPANMHVCLELDEARFFDLFLKLLNA
ncbi:nucleoside hydrolase [Terribacillus goriensis]|uniref:nucleoside hydrolase n=1 Tax=Terribacillus TaxID=459532 RepID=UPI00344D097E